jgi:O-antigen ligase
MRAALSVAVAALSLAVGLASLAGWVAEGLTPGARSWLAVWPMLALLCLAVVSAAAAVRQASPSEWALGLLAWALSARVVTELPPIASAHWLNDGPALVPAYLALGAALGLYGAAGPRAHGFEGRASAALALAFTSNAKLWTREPDIGFALLGAGVLLLFGAARRHRAAGEVLGGRARWLLGVALAFLAWSLAAALFGDAPARSAIVWSRCLTGALLAFSLASVLDSRGARTVFTALLAGLAASFALLAIGLYESAAWAGWSSVLHARLRLFDQHANGIGPLFSMGLALALAPLVFRDASRTSRILGASLLLPCVLALWRTESRASLLGAGVAVLALLWFRSGLLPRRPLRVAAGVLVLAAAAVLVFVSPAGAPLRSRLDAMTWGPSALGQRWHFWRMAVSAIAERPLLGWGPNTPWVHARYSAPSYYDGTPQDLHAHDLYLSVAEGTGWVGLALFVLLVLGALEVGRRALAREPVAESARFAVAGVFAALLGLLGCNLLDLGQSQTSFVPLFLWIALGTAAAAVLPGELERRDAGAARPIAALLLLLPLCAHPLAVRLCTEEGARRSDRAPGAFAASLPWLDCALILAPWDSRALRERAAVYQRIVKAESAPGDAAARAIADLQHMARSAPGRARGWELLAGAAVELGRTAIALDALARAEELDPRGLGRGDRSLQVARAMLLAGRRGQALGPLVEGFARGGGIWASLPHTPLPPQPADPPGAVRVGFVPVRGGAPIPMTLVLDRVVDRAVQAVEDPITSRRLLGSAVAGFAAQGLPAEAVAALARYEAAGGTRLPSTEAKLVPLLIAQGRVEEARTSLLGFGRSDPRVSARYALALLDAATAVDPARRNELLAEVEPLVFAPSPGDLFFAAGAAPELHDARARLQLRRGNEAAALAHHRTARFDRRVPAARVAADESFLRSLLAAGATEEAVAALVDKLLFDCSISAHLAPNEAGMRTRARWLRDAGFDPFAHGRLDEHGLASEAFRRAWEATGAQ